MKPAFATATILIPGLVACAATAAAQSQPVELEEGYSAERFRPATDRRGILDVESAEVGEPMAIELGVSLGYADDPLNLYRDGEGERERVGSLVSHRLGGNLIGAVTLGRVQIGVDLPIVLSQDEATGDLMTTGGSLSSFGLGDLRLVPKIEIREAGRIPVAVAAAFGVTVPTGSDAGYFGDDGGTLAPELLVSSRLTPRLRAGLNLGYRVRRSRRSLDLEIDDELYAHLGAAFHVTPALELLATAALATAAGDPLSGSDRLYSEVRAGAGYALGTLSLFAAAGTGTTEGFGSPDWRLVTGVRFALPRRPAERETPRRLTLTITPGAPGDTAPAAADVDRDGFVDSADRCPAEAEDVDEHEDSDGCPDRDNDGDEIADAQDSCPLEPGDAAQKGCPVPDRDGDGVLDAVDNCPAEAGVPAHQGCIKKQLVVLSGTGIAVLESVLFETNDAAVRLRSYPLLRNVADVLRAHPELSRIRVEGHTDDRGSDDSNLELSRRRAETVREFLVAQGIDPERLDAVGFGETRPIAGNDTSAGRAKNRRVEFVIQR